ncbi:MAG: YbjN domain-containing protein [Pseudomonadota bacterium]
MKIRLLVSLVITLLAVAQTAAADGLRNDYSTDEIINMLKAEGYGAVTEVESDDDSRYIEIKVDGLTYSMQVFDDGDLLLYFGMTGFDLTHRDINEWNRQQRLSRAYLDHENDPVLESDLLADAGYNAEHLARFVRIFLDSADVYREFLVNMDGGDVADGSATESI